jgi:hypothetical protein
MQPCVNAQLQKQTGILIEAWERTADAKQL